MRRLPVYLVIDTSGSMRGESIHSVNVGIQAMLSALRQIPTPSKAFISPLSPMTMRRVSSFLSRRWKTSSFLTSLYQAQAGPSPVLPLNV